MIQFSRSSSARKRRLLTCYIPRDLDLKQFPLQQHDVAYFLGLIHWGTVCWRQDDNDYVRLKRKYLDNVIPNFGDLRDRLLAMGVIGWDRDYRVGHRSQGYRLTHNYRKTKRITIDDPRFILKVERAYEAMSTPMQPVHSWLAGHLKRLDFDMGMARSIINSLKPNEDSPLSAAEYRVILTEQCRRIWNGDHFLFCDQFGRVHTPMTNLAKQLRCCLSVDGRSLLGLDLANSQPLIAGLVARQFHSNRGVAHRLRHRHFRLKAHPYRNRQLTTCNTDREDLVRYLAVCQQGQLYESLMQAGDDRDRLKRRFLTAMYGERHWSDKLRQRLELLYPSVAKMLHSLKKHNYAHAAHLMQNTEAVIFINGVCNRLRNGHRRLPIFTIHDSVLTIPDGVEVVRGAILNEFEQLGVRPTITLEEYGPVMK